MPMHTRQADDDELYQMGPFRGCPTLAGVLLARPKATSSPVFGAPS